MIPFIALDSRTKLKFDYPHPDILCFDDKGKPICPGGIPYQNWGYSKPKGIKYRCWFACHGQKPPQDCLCSNSPYGKVVYIKPNYDPRMFPPVPRHTKAFKLLKINSKPGRRGNGLIRDCLSTTLLKELAQGVI